MPGPIVVDCHSHIFNAEDLPIDGFIKRLSPVPSLLTGVLSVPLDRLTQWAAPGSGEFATILALLAPTGGLETMPAAAVPELPAPELLSDIELDARLMTLIPAAVQVDVEAGPLEGAAPSVEQAIEQALAAATPEQLEELAVWEEEWGVDDAELEPAQPGLEGIGDLLGRAKRLYKAAKRFVETLRLVARHRYQIAGQLASTYPQVRLFVPALVDFSATSRDDPSTSVQQQVTIHSLVAKLAATGGIPNAGHVRIHPLVGFCPYRETHESELAEWDMNAGTANNYVPYADPALATPQDRYTDGIVYDPDRARPLRVPIGPWESSHLDLHGITRSLDIVRHAVELGGFAGVKLYPPAGFLPIGNVGRFGERVGARLDAALRALYAYCVAEEVPILTHAARSNGFDDGFDDLAGPTGWQQVLGDYPDLRICFGHFGHLHGIGDDVARPSATSWVMRFTQLIDSHRHVYADVGNSRYVYDDAYHEDFDAVLAALMGSGSGDAEAIRHRRRRLMFGSDYWMNTMNPKHDKFVDRFSTGIENLFGAETRSWFMGANAVRWLGITNDDDQPDKANHNRKRLMRFYGTQACPEWLLD